ncbi:hypothetical protein RIF29_34625 [Crotalaria pallida]|uniref:ZF-HD dimerization-type domain-containing protein n=1 Tax=Crotalaria pallida TaxID=3830 RepID=A0AAN9EAA9_CROPI
MEPNNFSVDKKPEKKIIRYMQCLKNHAASLGGSATDGCGEFMPSGEEGTLEALMCSACNCHRNFHRKEVLRESDSDHYSQHNNIIIVPMKKPISAHLSLNKSGSISPSDQSDEKDHDDRIIREVENVSTEKVKKRFRTKFTHEQKVKMLAFAEKAGWKIQKLEEAAVYKFCQEIGIKRRVLKVWMHNNKNTSVKRSISNS